MKLLLISLSLVLCVSPPAIFAQTESGTKGDEVLARVGPRAITAGEFLDRIDLMPWPGKDNPGTRDSAKIRALASLVAEKLLSLQAVDQGYIENANTSASVKSLERLLARDVLYRNEILGKVTATPDQIDAGLPRLARTLRLSAFVMNSEQTAKALAAALNAQPDSAVPVPWEGITSHDTLTINFCDLVPAYEDSVYALSRMNDACAVYSPDAGWAVFQLVESSSNADFARLSVPQREAAVKQALKKRSEKLLSSVYVHDFFSDSMRMDSVLFLACADSLLTIMRRDSDGHKQGEYFRVQEDDVDHLRHVLSPYLGKPFIAMGDYQVSLEDMILELRFFPVHFRSLKRTPFLQILNRDLRTMAEGGLTSEEAMRRKLNESPDVRGDLNKWIEAMQADKLLKHLLDSLGHVYGVHRNDSVAAKTAGPDTSGNAVVKEIDNYILRLATKYKTAIYFEKLKDLTISPTNMVTRRYIGFGGGMVASPMLLQVWDWLKYWEHPKNIAP